MPLAPQRQKFTVFVSPQNEDFIFYETVDSQRVGEEIPEYQSPHPDTDNYPNHYFVFASQEEERDRLSYRYYYAAKRDNQDDYNWEFSSASLGGTRYDTVVRSYVTLRSEYSEDQPELASAMPITAKDPFSAGDGYILLDTEQKRIGERELDSVFIREQKTFIKRVPITSLSYDDLFGQQLHIIETVYHMDESPPEVNNKTIAQLLADPDHEYWALNNDGYLRTAVSASANWAVVRQRQVIKMEEGTTLVRSFNTTENFTWPNVLSEFRVDIYNKKRGGADVITTPIFKRSMYRGPCSASVEMHWQKDPFTDINPDEPMLPTSVSVNTVLASFNSPASLHNGTYVPVIIGTEDPVYEMGSWQFTVEPTNYLDWPSKILASDDQRPFRGGYLRQKTTIHNPLN